MVHLHFSSKTGSTAELIEMNSFILYCILCNILSLFMRMFSLDTVIITYEIVAQRYASFLLQTYWCEGTKKYGRSLLLTRYVN